MSIKIALRPVPEGFKVRIEHVTDPQELQKQVRKAGDVPPRFVTWADVLDEQGHVVAFGGAFCSHKDNPSRKMGRAIAHNRALKYLERATAARAAAKPVAP